MSISAYINRRSLQLYGRVCEQSREKYQKMGKSGGKRKKGGGSNKTSVVENSSPTANADAEHDSSTSLKRSHDSKEEGNTRFHNNDFAGALPHYGNALRLMQIKPIDYKTVIAECTMALQAQPRFVRALLLRARAFESLGNYEMALQDVKATLAAEPTHADALEIAQRLRTALEPRHSLPGPKKPEPVLPPEPKPKPKPSDESFNRTKDNQKEQVATIVWRPLKLVYDHDIRLAEMPVNCSFRVLRDTVRKRFPTSNSVLIKYKDNDGDLVTITSTEELRLAESSVDKNDSVGMLKLNIVEVSPDQEPPLLEEEEEEEEEEEDEKGKEKPVNSGECVLDKAENQKNGGECKELEMDDWLFEFAQLFRSRVGIDADSHVDLREFGMEFCSEALEETVTSEEAQGLFNKAALKFQEVAALAFFNWGNVHMCAARKRVPLDENEVVVVEQYDWVKEKYYLAREKYEQALVIKPDLYEGLLALGQQQFELAKLHWSFALAEKVDLSKETLELFNVAEEKMKAATYMWEKLEKQRARKERDGSGSKKEEEKPAEQGGVMGSQIHLFWGNMLFERSQVECKLGMGDWKKNLDAAVERFKLAGASEADVSLVLKKHCSNGNAREGEVKGSKTRKPIALLK